MGALGHRLPPIRLGGGLLRVRGRLRDNSVVAEYENGGDNTAWGPRPGRIRGLPGVTRRSVPVSVFLVHWLRTLRDTVVHHHFEPTACLTKIAMVCHD